jgi:MFS family permease
MTAKARPVRRAGPLQAIALILPNFLGIMGTASLVPVMPRIAAEYAASPHAQLLAQLVLVLPSLMIVLLSPVAGWLGDHFGRRRLLMTFMVLYSAVGLLPIVVEGIFTLLVCRAVLGVCEAVVMTLATTLLGDYFFGEERDHWMGYQTGAGSVAGLLLLPLAGFLGQFGWRMSFGIYILPLFMLVLVVHYTWEPEASTETISSVALAPVAGSVRAHIIANSAVSLFASLLFFVALLQSGVAFSHIGLDDPGRIGVLASLAGLGGPAGALIFRCINQWRTPLLTGIAFLILGAGLIATGSANTSGPLTAALFLAQLGGGIVVPTMLTWAVRNAPFELRGRSIGIWQGVFTGGQFISGMMFGFLLQNSPGPSPVFHGLGIASLAGGALAWITLASRRHLPPPKPARETA